MHHTYNHIIGVDISKNRLDVCLLKELEKGITLQVENSKQGLKKVSSLLRKEDIEITETLICAEHTGIYTNPLTHFCTENNWNLSLQSGIQIKKSLGIQRGKNDKVDAKRIAQYACRFQDKCLPWEAPRKEVLELKKLFSERQRLIKLNTQVKLPLKEAGTFGSQDLHKDAIRRFRPVLRGIEKSLAKTEEKIETVIQNDTQLRNMMKVLLSIEGIGQVTAIGLLIATNEFKVHKEAPKLACYAGVAPFEHQSGTSIRGRNRVSHMANKPLKTLLYMAALSAIKSSNEIRAYYERKVEEGKPKMLVINAVKNKLIARVCACIREGRPYKNTHRRMTINRS